MRYQTVPIELLHRMAAQSPQTQSPQARSQQHNRNGHNNGCHKTDSEWAREYLAALRPERADSREDWITVGMALHSVGDDSLLSDWIEFSKKSPKYQEGEPARKWATFRSTGVALGTLGAMAKEDGWRPRTNKNGDHRPPQTKQARTFAVGDIVSPTDRDNWGEIVAITGTTASVHFVSPEGKEATKDFDFSELRRQGEQQTTDAPAYRAVPISEFLDTYPHLRKEVIAGLLRQGETMNLVAPTKVGKSWLTYTIAMSVATGRPVFGAFGTYPGRVLLIDNELHPETISWRLKTVIDALGLLPSDIADRIDIISLRGNLIDLRGLKSTFDELERGKYSLVIGDAWYRFLPEGVSENDNAQMMQMYNLLDSYMGQIESSWIGIHHSSKGIQSDKRVTDVGSGAGSQSRAADAHVVLREHQQEGVVVLEASLRSFKPVDPIPLRWSFPLWTPAGGVDPKALKRVPTRQEEAQAERDREGKDAIITLLAQQGSMTRKQIRTKTGIGYDRSNRLVSQLLKDGEVIELGDAIGLRGDPLKNGQSGLPV